MCTSKDLESALKDADPEIREYVTALQAENSRLVKNVAKAEAKLTTANSMIEEYKKGKTPNPINYMSDEELMNIAKGKK